MQRWMMFLSVFGSRFYMHGTLETCEGCRNANGGWSQGIWWCTGWTTNEAIEGVLA